jgi:hypothetical protein
MSRGKEIRDIIRQLEAQGWTVTKGKRSGHWKAMAPGGKGIVYFPGTPSDWRSVANTKSRLRQLGATIQ